MERHVTKVEAGGRGSSGTHSVSRWSPTKEQICVLETLYKQGIRTPNAEQIQHITTRLKEYGHIEGKNVFYWFQNHKARQRQKLKQHQQSIGYSNCFLHTSQTLCQNVVCAPYCWQQSGISFYPQQPNVHATGGIISRIEKVVPFRVPRMCNGPQIHEQLNQSVLDYNFSTSNNRKALTLFPLHPTGILEGKTTDQVLSLASISVDVTDSFSASHIGEDCHTENQPFFDFFTSERGSRESD